MSPNPSVDFSFNAAALEYPLVRRHVSALLRAWLYGLQHSTRKNFTFDLHQFAGYVLGEELPPPRERDDTRSAAVLFQILRTHSDNTAISGFVEWLLARRGCSRSTAVRKLKSLRLWARHLYERRAVPRNLDAFPLPCAEALESSTPPSSLGEQTLLEHLSPDVREHAYAFLEARDQALSTVLAHSTLRPTNLIDLEWRGVDFGAYPDEDSILPPVRVKVLRLDGGTRWLTLTATASRALRHWHLAYVRFFCGAPPTHRAFTTITGKRMSPSRLGEPVDD